MYPGALGEKGKKKKCRSDCVLPFLNNLHWLPDVLRIQSTPLARSPGPFLTWSLSTRSFLAAPTCPSPPHALAMPNACFPLASFNSLFILQILSGNPPCARPGLG